MKLISFSDNRTRRCLHLIAVSQSIWNEARILEIESSSRYRKYKESAHMVCLTNQISKPSKSPLSAMRLTTQRDHYDMKSKLKLLYDRQSVSQSVCLGIEHPCGTCDQILYPVGMLLSEICGLVSIGRPL
jgi:hypothetical protein